MKLGITSVLTALVFVTPVTAATSPLPARILCTPDQHSLIGAENLNATGVVAHLFEYGGTVNITKDGDHTQFSYHQAHGRIFYTLKEKKAYSKGFVASQRDVFMPSDPDWAGGGDSLTLTGEIQGGYFYIDWARQRYYGLIREFSALNSYDGSCEVLQNNAHLSMPTYPHGRAAMKAEWHGRWAVRDGFFADV